MMKYSVEEVIQFIREEDVKFIQLSFCDILGDQKTVAVMPYEIERVFSSGFAVDPTAIVGFHVNGVTEAYLRPDPSTVALLPWRPESGSVVRLFCNVTKADSTPLETDCRSLLIGMVQEAAAQGISFELGTSMEFYLFKNDDNDLATRVPHDTAGYMDTAPADKGEPIRKEIQLNLERMGIVPKSSHHEGGPGQNEIDFLSADPVTSADNAITFAQVVRTTASVNGLTADFTPRPVMEFPGSGMHVNIAVHSESGEDLLDMAVAGILDKISEITVFLDPTENSYERLGRDRAPRYISWSTGDRSHLVRIPQAADGVRRAELRSPDSSANPYLVYALIIAAALYGIRSRLELMPPSEVNLYRSSLVEADKLRSLPVTLKQAREAAAASDFVKNTVPGPITDFYLKRR